MRLAAASCLILMLASGAAHASGSESVAKKFAAALRRQDLDAARKFLVAEPKINEWSDGDTSLERLASYMQSCPLGPISSKKNGNVDVSLNCKNGWDGMSLKFEGKSIKQVDFGPPPSGLRGLLPPGPGIKS